jgi:hypothetical protein
VERPLGSGLSTGLQLILKDLLRTSGEILKKTRKRILYIQMSAVCLSAKSFDIINDQEG